LIRAASERDADAVVALWTAAYFTEGKGGRAGPYARPDFDRTVGKGPVLVAESDGEVVGVVALIPPGEGGAVARPDEAELSRLTVAAGERRRGVGHALVNRCTELAHAEGWPAIALWSREYQTAAHRLYESLGYERRPDRDTIDETGHSRLVFRLAL